MASANGASSESRCHKKSDGSQGARRGSPDMPNESSNVWHTKLRSPNLWQAIGKIDFVQKKTPKKSPIWLDTKLSYLDAKPLTPNQVLDYVWVPWGITRGGWYYRKIINSRSIGIFSSYRQIIDIEKHTFGVYRKVIDPLSSYILNWKTIKREFHIPDEYDIIFENSAQSCAAILAEYPGL